MLISCCGGDDLVVSVTGLWNVRLGHWASDSRRFEGS